MGTYASAWRCGGGSEWPGCRGGVLRAGDRHGWREVEQRREQLPDAEARVGGEAEFDLLAPHTGNDDVYRPLGKQLRMARAPAGYDVMSVRCLTGAAVVLLGLGCMRNILASKPG
jgi:hypothetical protein